MDIRIDSRLDRGFTDGQKGIIEYARLQQPFPGAAYPSESTHAFQKRRTGRIKSIDCLHLLNKEPVKHDGETYIVQILDKPSSTFVSKL